MYENEFFPHEKKVDKILIHLFFFAEQKFPTAIEMQQRKREKKRGEMFTKNIRQCHVLTRVRTSGDKRRLKDFHTCKRARVHCIFSHFECHL